MKPNFYFCILLLFFFASCATRNIVYFSDLPQDITSIEPIQNAIEPRIQPVDLLDITVSTLNPESNVLFNSGILTTIGSSGSVGNTARINDGYRVDKEGNINFPVLGKVHLAGLTIDEATEKMTDLLQLEVKNPIVNVKLINFRITVIGEVSRPSTISVPTEKINIMEAIGLAGDLTAYGKRENVMLMREKNGERTITRLNLNNKSVLSSPYFYLEQNDIIYVEPVRARAAQATNTRDNFAIIMSLLSFAIVTVFRFID